MLDGRSRDEIMVLLDRRQGMREGGRKEGEGDAVGCSCVWVVCWIG